MHLRESIAHSMLFCTIEMSNLPLNRNVYIFMLFKLYMGYRFYSRVVHITWRTVSKCVLKINNWEKYSNNFNNTLFNHFMQEDSYRDENIITL